MGTDYWPVPTTYLPSRPLKTHPGIKVTYLHSLTSERFLARVGVGEEGLPSWPPTSHALLGSFFFLNTLIEL